MIVLNQYKYGSKVYGTDNEKSDTDIILITPNKNVEQMIIPLFNLNITYYGKDQFQKLIDDHEISALECFFLPEEHKQETVFFTFNLDKVKLRHSISNKASNSFVKSKKKLTLQEEENYLDLGLKSLFHSLRIITFGIQIASYGGIYDYSEANHYLKEIKEIGGDWNKLKEKFQPIYNLLMTQFRTLAPKE